MLTQAESGGDVTRAGGGVRVAGRPGTAGKVLTSHTHACRVTTTLLYALIQEMDMLSTQGPESEHLQKLFHNDRTETTRVSRQVNGHASCDMCSGARPAKSIRRSHTQCGRVSEALCRA